MTRIRRSHSSIARVVGETGLIALGFLLVVSAGLTGTRWLTVHLSPLEYGELALYTTAALLCQQVFLMPVSQAGLRFLAPAVESGTLPALLAVLARMLFWRSALLVGAGALAVIVLSLGGVHVWSVVPPLLLLAIALGVGGTIDGLQNAARRRSAVAFNQGLSQWARVICAIALIKALSATSRSALKGYALGALFALAGQWVLFSRTAPPFIGTPPLLPRIGVDAVKRYARAFSLWGAFTWAHLISDRWAIQLFGTTAQVGLYQALYQIGFYPIMIIAALIVQVAAPILFETSGDGSDVLQARQSDALHRKVVTLAVVATIAAVAAAVPLHRIIFGLAVAPQYQSVSRLLPWVVLSGGLMGCGHIACIRFMSAGNAEQLIVPKIVTACGGIAMNLLGAFYWGLEGVVAAGPVVGAAYVLWLRLLRPHRCGTHHRPAAAFDRTCHVRPRGTSAATPA